MKNPFDLTGQVAVITGSSRGIGRSAAEIMASLGAKVVISSRKADACEEVVAAIRKAGGEAIVIPCNISRKEEVEGAVTGTSSSGGRSTRWCAMRRSTPTSGRWAKHLRRAVRQDHELQHQEQYLALQLRHPGMAEKGGGSVIIVSSIGGLRGSAMLGAYGISKAADFQLARSLAVEWGPKNMRVNCVAPGLIKTDFARALWENAEALKPRLRRRHCAASASPTRSAASSPSSPPRRPRS